MPSDIPEFWSRFIDSDFDAIPPKARKFLHRESSAASWMQTTGYFAHGYAYAFERMVMIAIDQWPNAEYLQMPTFYLARHAAELHLKGVICEYALATNRNADTSSEHRLLWLWTEAEAQIQAAGWTTDDRWSEHCRRLVQHLHEVDPRGERFRYPHNNAGKAFAYTRVELEGLAMAHAHITTWCGAAIDMLKEGQP